MAKKNLTEAIDSFGIPSADDHEKLSTLDKARAEYHSKQTGDYHQGREKLARFRADYHQRMAKDKRGEKPNLGEKLSEDEAQRAAAADLVTLPKNIEGTNCGNCKFFSDGQCMNENVSQPVTDRQCCVYWDAEGVKRPWKKMVSGEE